MFIPLIPCHGNMPNLSANLLLDVALCETPLTTTGALVITGDSEQSLPLDMLMVLDMSGSMRGEGETILGQTANYTLEKLMRPQDRLAIITFSQGAQLHSDWVGPGSQGSVAPFKAGGGTNFGAAIKETLSFLGSNNKDDSRAGVVLFLSDGHAGQTASDQNVLTIPEFGFTMHTMGVTSGANPNHLDHMAELARGFYFDSPSYQDVQQSFESLFNYGQTISYSAPDLRITVSDGVEISEIIQVPQGLEIEKGPLGPGSHTVSLSHMTVGMRSELSFRVKVQNVECSDNLLATFECINGRTELRVKGTQDKTDLLGAQQNSVVTLISETGKAARLIKTGDTSGATRAITRIDTLTKTNPNAGTVAKTLTDVSTRTSTADQLESLGKLQVDKDGKTQVRED